MKNVLRITLSMFLASVIATGVIFQLACDRKEMVSYAEDIVAGVNDAIPILSAAGAPTANLQIAANIGSNLVVAFKNNETANAVDLTAALIPAFEAVFSDANLIRDPGQRTIALATLAIARVGLRYISKRMVEEASKLPQAARSGGKAATITRFAKTKDWHCRDSVSGQFKKMEYCKAHPATSQVETY
jgi:hypothetical protein